MAIEITSVPEPRRLPPFRRASQRVQQEATRARGRAGLLRLLVAGLIVSAGALVVTLAYFYVSYSKIVDERLASGYLTSRAGIYAAPRVLRNGQRVSRERLVEILRRAGYVDAEASNVWSGRFIAQEDSVLIHPRRGTGAAGETQPFDEVRVEFDKKNRISNITADGASLASYALEPEALTNDAHMKTGERATLAYGDIPPVLARAILSIEDRRFFEHRGVDGLGIARAVWTWAVSGAGGGETRRQQGGSTITQQLVKNTYLSPERTLRRKFNEAVIASVLERRLSKEDIFALYCNEIYLGQRGGVGVRGVAQAARLYFGKGLKDLSLAEAATVAGMIQSPARYAPDRHPERAKVRRDTVLEAMLGEGFVTREQAEAAKREPVAVVPVTGAGSATAPHFIDYVNRVVESGLESEGRAADERSLRVYTTIDLELQQLAERAVGRQLERLEKVYKGKRRPQATLVALDPQTGHVLAMVGGSRYGESQLNRATDARRQPGSVFKPFVYAAALESGVSPVSMFADAPQTFRYDRRATYRPSNYGGGYSMRDVTMRAGLVRSLNTVTVDVATRAGLSRVAGLAESFGLPRPAAYPSLALGTTEATPLEIAAAYAAFANGGRAVRPATIARATDAANTVFINHTTQPRQVIRPSTAYMITDMLGAVIEQGTARAARGALKGTAVAGKTGTSRDGWFAGYTPNLVCVVWIGFDDGDQLGLTGAESALPAWVEFVRGAVELRPELGGEHFTRPAGISIVEIDPETGFMASPTCPRRERVAVTGSHAPSYECYTHSPAYTSIATLDADGYSTTDSLTTEVAAPTYGGSAATSLTTQTAARAVVVSQLPRTTPRVPSSAVLVEPLPRAKTRVEKIGGGRSKLTNEIRLTDPDKDQ